MTSKDAFVKFDCTFDIPNINFKVYWQINANISREFEFVLTKIEVSDVDRMSKILDDFMKIKTNMNEQIQIIQSHKNEEVNKLTEEIKELKKNLAIKDNTNNLINITIYKDSTRRDYVNGQPVIKFKVNKKRPETTLLVQANLCVHGEGNAETCQFWKYGGTTSCGQSECYSNNSGYARSVMCSCVITGHATTGEQELKLEWLSGMTPFMLLNPNKADHPNFGECQTCSIVRVEEILQ